MKTRNDRSGSECALIAQGLVVTCACVCVCMHVLWPSRVTIKRVVRRLAVASSLPLDLFPPGTSFILLKLESVPPGNIVIFGERFDLFSNRHSCFKHLIQITPLADFNKCLSVDMTEAVDAEEAPPVGVVVLIFVVVVADLVEALAEAVVVVAAVSEVVEALAIRAGEYSEQRS